MQQNTSTNATIYAATIVVKRSQPFGELALIQQIRQDFASPRRRGITLGIGDDCAILRPPPGSEVVVTTDFTLEGRHFRRDLHPPASVGHRCLARGLSDLASMGATPLAAFLSLALPGDLLTTAYGRRWIDSFFFGMNNLTKKLKVPLAGGDTAEAPENSILADITLVGTVPTGRALRRSGARVGDLLYVTGALGGAAAELDGMMARGSLPPKNLRPAEHPQMYPEPRIAIGRKLLSSSLATACIDLSDGLSTDLAHLCRESRTGAEIEASAIPLHKLSLPLGAEGALRAALDGGEDYELLFAARPSVKIPRSIAGVKVTRVGQVTRKSLGVTLRSPDGSGTPLDPRGWEHFAAGRARRAER